MVDLQHRYTLGPSSLLVSQVSYKSFDADLTPNSSAPYEVGVREDPGGFFDQQRRRSKRRVQETWELALRRVGGYRIFKAGTD